MGKVQFNCRLPEEILTLISSEVERLQGETEKKVSQADVVGLAMVKWCTGETVLAEISSEFPDRRAIGGAAMREAESRPAQPPPALKANPRSESAAQRKARESKAHAIELAESDVAAKAMGRDDIEYDLDAVPHRSVAAMAVQPKGEAKPQRTYEVIPRKVKPLARPHGNTEPKRKREQ